MDLTIGDGTLTIGPTSGVTGTGSGGSLTLTGSVNNINNALAGLTYTPTNTGNATLSISVNDQGSFGAGGPLSDHNLIQIEVLDFVPVNIVGPLFIDDPGGTKDDSPGDLLDSVDVILSGNDLNDRILNNPFVPFSIDFNARGPGQSDLIDFDSLTIAYVPSFLRPDGSLNFFNPSGPLPDFFGLLDHTFNQGDGPGYGQGLNWIDHFFNRIKQFNAEILDDDDEDDPSLTPVNDGSGSPDNPELEDVTGPANGGTSDTPSQKTDDLGPEQSGETIKF